MPYRSRHDSIVNVHEKTHRDKVGNAPMGMQLTQLVECRTPTYCQ